MSLIEKVLGGAFLLAVNSSWFILFWWLGHKWNWWPPLAFDALALAGVVSFAGGGVLVLLGTKNTTLIGTAAIAVFLVTFVASLTVLIQYTPF